MRASGNHCQGRHPLPKRADGRSRPPRPQSVPGDGTGGGPLHEVRGVSIALGSSLSRMGEYAAGGRTLGARRWGDSVRRGSGTPSGLQQPTRPLARRCAESYAKAGQPARAGAVLRDYGLEVEAAEYYCQAGEWETGSVSSSATSEFDRRHGCCQAPGARRWSSTSCGESELLGRRARGGRSAGIRGRAAAVARRRDCTTGSEYAKAAEMYARQETTSGRRKCTSPPGIPAKRPCAGTAREAARKRPSTINWRGRPPRGRRLLQEIGDFFGAASLLLGVGAVEEAMALLQQVGAGVGAIHRGHHPPGDLFLERNSTVRRGRSSTSGRPATDRRRTSSTRPISWPAMHERQGNLQEALRLYEKVMAEQFDYRDVQAAVADLWERLAGATQALAWPGTGEGRAPAKPRPRVPHHQKEVGRGGMGIVYQAEDEILQRQVAYKVMPDAVRDDPKALEYFLREARIAASLHHPNIVTIYDAGQTADDVYIAMEYVEGRSLQDILDEVRVLSLSAGAGDLSAGLPEPDPCPQTEIVHRDVKPANIMITARRDGEADGLRPGGCGSRTPRQGHLGAGHALLHGAGTDPGEDDLGLRGSVRPGLHALPHGDGSAALHRGGRAVSPHPHRTRLAPASWNPKIPVWLDAIILRTMVKSPDKRFPSVEVVLREVDRNLAGAGRDRKPRDARPLKSVPSGRPAIPRGRPAPSRLPDALPHVSAPSGPRDRRSALCGRCWDGLERMPVGGLPALWLAVPRCRGRRGSERPLLPALP